MIYRKVYKGSALSDRLESYSLVHSLHFAAVRLICEPNSEQMGLCDSSVVISERKKKSMSNDFLHVHQCDPSAKRLYRTYELTERCLFRDFQGHHDIRANSFRQVGGALKWLF